MSNNNPGIAKKNIIVRWRKKKQLCLRCGKDLHDDSGLPTCTETYETVDNRNIEEEVKPINENKKKETVIQYRKKKQLCLRCGKDEHIGTECEENYESSDLRSEEEKQIDPRIVATPKAKIFDHIIESNDISIEPNGEAGYNRPYIIVDIRKNDINNMTFSELRYLSARFSNCIICILGDINSIYPYADVINLNKITNIIRMVNDHDQQNVINHICGCKYYIGQDSEYSRYSISKNIKTVIIKKDTDIKNIMSRIPKVKDD